MSDQITLTIDDGETAYEVSLPCKWAICENCRGNGTHAHSIGAITSSEWAHDWDEDERSDYLAGRYDRQCEECGGSGKVRVVDETLADPDDLLAWQGQEQREAEWAAQERAERRLGC
jgi:hypothetical protein